MLVSCGAACLQYFSCYQHLTSEYERRDIIEKFERLHGKLAQVHHAGQPQHTQ